MSEAPVGTGASIRLAGLTGFEPATSSLTGWHSKPLSYSPTESGRNLPYRYTTYDTKTAGRCQCVLLR